MLSYKHAFHAGNHADVLKHSALVHILTYLKRKAPPLVYIDTHAGAGGYSLLDAEALKTAEFSRGAALLWKAGDRPEMVGDYLNLLRGVNPDGGLAVYPGSPQIAARLLGEKDRLRLFELHNNEYRGLTARFAKDPRVKLFNSDGLQGLLASLPPAQSRALVLIDPSYEIKSDYEAVTETLIKAYKKFAVGVFMLWYPVVERRRVQRLEQAIRQSGVRRIVQFELSVRPDAFNDGMTGSGLFVVNPPWTLQASMDETLPYLAATLGESGRGVFRSETLVGE
ncbi:MAG: 23S rRNA (adenine(2030)-N(6))-methyltransferase RlmJ [Gammaproteobacteria bacterium]|nr:23S rRNA (adenine(2030)-N(6))-methyltransferase RlmJ [Gammaproteobacteria bacterium]